MNDADQNRLFEGLSEALAADPRLAITIVQDAIMGSIDPEVAGPGLVDAAVAVSRALETLAVLAGREASDDAPTRSRYGATLAPALEGHEFVVGSTTHRADYGRLDPGVVSVGLGNGYELLATPDWDGVNEVQIDINDKDGVNLLAVLVPVVWAPAEGIDANIARWVAAVAPVIERFESELGGIRR